MDAIHSSEDSNALGGVAPAGGSSTDEAAIRATIARMFEAWNRNDAGAYASPFEDDSDDVSFDGTRVRGRAANEAAHRLLFETVLAHTRLIGEVEDVRFVTGDVAVVHATGAVAWPWHAEVPKKRRSRQTVVFVKREGTWRATAFQNTRIRPVPTIRAGSLLVRAFRAWVRLREAIAGTTRRQEESTGSRTR
jgi:uncharacterized protein (TIGR02246 family)